MFQNIGCRFNAALYFKTKLGFRDNMKNDQIKQKSKQHQHGNFQNLETDLVVKKYFQT